MPAVLPVEDRRKMVSIMVTRGIPTTSIARRIGVPAATVRKDRLILSVPNPDEVTKPSSERLSPMRYSKSDKPLSSLDPVTRRAEVAKLYSEGNHGAQIARSLGVSSATVSRDLEALGIVVTEAAEGEVQRRREKVKELLDKGTPDPDIARELGISQMTVIRDRALLGFTPSRIGREKAIAERRAKVQAMIADGMTSKAIASALGVTDMMVLRDCEALGVVSTSSVASVTASRADRRASVKEMFEQKLTLNEIAERLDVNPMTVRRDLAALNLK